MHLPRGHMADTLPRLQAALADRYRVERELGAGGMATVFLAEDLKHHRKVAVKVLRPDLAAILGPDRFLREVTIAANLQHPHILPLYDSGQTDGFLYYVMPFVEGPSLRQKLVREGELPVADAVRILRDVADAMAYAHHHGVVHRDIKPENVMLADRHALVTDFGVAKAVSEATGRQTLTTVGVALGTPTYMAPEQAAADPHVDHRADIYAFGVMAYELLTGRPPFVGGSPQQVLAMHVTQAAEPVTRHRAAIPPMLASLIMRCLEKKPADRWQTADELMPQLEAVLTPSGGLTPTATMPITGVAQPVRRISRPVAAGALVLMVALASTFWYRWARPRPVVADRVAVLPFENRTGNADLDDRGPRFAETLIEAIGRSGAAEPVASAVIRDLASGTSDHSKLAALASRRTQAGLVLRGAYYRAQQGVEVRAEVLRMPGEEQRFAFSVSGPVTGDSLLGAVAERAQVVLTLEKEWGPGVSWQGEHIPASMNAVREFLRAVDLETKGDTAWYGAYETALRADSGWVYPFDGTIRAELARRNQQTGWDLARKRVATFEREHQLTQGDREYLDWVGANLAGDTEGYYQAVKKLFARRPSEYSSILLSATYWSFRLNEVLEHRDLLDAPGFWNAPSRRNQWALWAHVNVGYALHLLGKYQEAIELSRHIRAEFPDSPIEGTVHEMRALAALGRIADLERVLDEHERGGTGGYSVSRAMIAALELGTHGHEEAAQAMYRRSARFLQARVDRGDTTAVVFNELVLSLLYAKDFDQLERVVPRLLAAGDSVSYIYYLGAAAVYQGDRARATEVIRRLARIRPESPYSKALLLYIQAAIAAILDDKSEAVELLREARRSGYNLNHELHQDPDLRGLRGYPAFEEFIRPRQ